MNLYKILKYVAVALAVIGVVLLARVLFTGDDALETSASLQSSVVSPFLILSYFILGLTVLFVLIFVVKKLLSGNIKKTLISIGAFILVVVIAYLITDGVETTLKDGDILSASASHWVSAGLVIFYILAAFAIGTMIFSGVKKLIKS